MLKLCILASKLRALAVSVLGMAAVLSSPDLSVAEGGPDSGQSRSARPKIGLVLEGGGALGFAHVGVLKVLEENRVPIDVITGTSIGSIVGAGYASGLTVAEMEAVLSETDWDELFGERIHRSNLTYRLKPGRGRELYGDAKISLDDGSIASPAGLISGQSILPLFQRLFGNLPAPTDFDRLPIPFRAITADLETGQAYVPSSGNLATVVRASMSVPGVFSPVELDGRLLVDGGIVDNLPVGVARELGAEVLIVSVLDDELAKRDDLTSLLSVSGQMISLLLQQNSTISRKTILAKDVLVPVDLKGYTVGDFAKAREIMEIGEAAARNYVKQMQRYSLTADEYERYRQQHLRKQAPPVKLDFVRLKNNSNISDERILKQVRLKAGDSFDEKTIEEDVQRIFGSGYYSTVRYNLILEDGHTGVEIEANGKPWLDQFARLGFALEDNLEGDDAFRLGVAYRHYNLTSRGSYGELQLDVGKNPRAGLELYQPFGDDSPYFISPIVLYSRNELDVRSEGTTIANYKRTEQTASLFVGRELGTSGEALMGVTRGFGELDRDIGDPTLRDIDYDIGDAIARVDIDTLDTPDFPTTGFASTVMWNSSLSELGADDDFDSVLASTALPLTWDRSTIILRGEYANTFDPRPIERSMALGGFVNVSGYLPGALVASDYSQGRLVALHRFSEVHNPIFNIGFFLGGSFELTSARIDAPELSDHTGIVSGSVFLGMDTPLLPTYFGFGVNDEQEHSLYLIIGRLGQSR